MSSNTQGKYEVAGDDEASAMKKDSRLRLAQSFWQRNPEGIPLEALFGAQVRLLD